MSFKQRGFDKKQNNIYYGNITKGYKIKSNNNILNIIFNKITKKK